MRRMLTRLRCSWDGDHRLTERRGRVHPPADRLDYRAESWYTCRCGQKRGVSFWRPARFEEITAYLWEQRILDWLKQPLDVWRNAPSVEVRRDG